MDTNAHYQTYMKNKRLYQNEKRFRSTQVGGWSLFGNNKIAPAAAAPAAAVTAAATAMKDSMSKLMPSQSFSEMVWGKGDQNEIKFDKCTIGHLTPDTKAEIVTALESMSKVKIQNLEDKNRKLKSAIDIIDKKLKAISELPTDGVDQKSMRAYKDKQKEFSNNMENNEKKIAALRQERINTLALIEKLVSAKPDAIPIPVPEAPPAAAEPVIPDLSDISETSVVSDVSETPVASDISETPVVSETSIALETSDVPTETSDVPTETDA